MNSNNKSSLKRFVQEWFLRKFRDKLQIPLLRDLGLIEENLNGLMMGVS